MADADCLQVQFTSVSPKQHHMLWAPCTLHLSFGVLWKYAPTYLIPPLKRVVRELPVSSHTETATWSYSGDLSRCDAAQAVVVSGATKPFPADINLLRRRNGKEGRSWSSPLTASRLAHRREKLTCMTPALYALFGCHGLPCPLRLAHRNSRVLHGKAHSCMITTAVHRRLKK